MTKSKFKELRLRFISVSMIVTSLILIVLQGGLYLESQHIIALPTLARNIMDSVSVIIAVLFFSSLLLRLTIKRVFVFFEEPEERIFYTKIYTWTLYGLGVFFILYHFGVSLGNLTLFIGLVATGLAFAVRDVLLSFFGWIILLRKKPFRIGDYIKIENDEGRVIHIGTFHVLIDKTSESPEDFTRVPNRLFLEKSVNIFGKRALQERISIALPEPLNNWPAFREKLIADIRELPRQTEHIEVNLDIVNEKLHLIIEYKVPFESRVHVRTDIIAMVFEIITPPHHGVTKSNSHPPSRP
jgi:MscS family membrane protein